MNNVRDENYEEFKRLGTDRIGTPSQSTRSKYTNSTNMNNRKKI